MRSSRNTPTPRPQGTGRCVHAPTDPSAPPAPHSLLALDLEKAWVLVPGGWRRRWLRSLLFLPRYLKKSHALKLSLLVFMLMVKLGL